MDMFCDAKADTHPRAMTPSDAAGCELHAALAGAMRASLEQRGAGGQGPAEVACGIVDVRDWRRWHYEARCYLSTRDLRQLDRLRRLEERQWRSMGYALLRLWLSVQLDLAPSALEIQRDHVGRPMLPQPLGDVSLSHAGPWCAFGYARQGRVGVDLEASERASGMDGLESYVCHPGDDVRQADAADPDRTALLRLWTRKEAALKREGLGLSCEPRTFAAPVAQPFWIPGVEDAVEVTEIALGAPVHLAIAHAPGARPVGHWLRP